jgi:hypothetical protein
VNPASLASFTDELEKIAAAAGLTHVPKTRTGRRPISVDALLEKDKDGEWLRKKAGRPSPEDRKKIAADIVARIRAAAAPRESDKLADAAGNPQDVRGDSVDDPGAAPLPKRRGEVPTKDPGNIPQSEKSGGTTLSSRIARLLERKPYLKQAYRLTDTTIPLSWGEDMRAQTTVQSKPGDVPTQSNNAVDQPDLRSAAPLGRMKPALVDDTSAKKPKKGDVPTQNRDMNIIDRFDGRESATTVTGLGQHSTNIGAMQNTVEHT